ncbi:hypothetical protein [Streptomyces sp. NPDC097619]|uniref:hypothetical protein n=1 Tax=Streptomyces sp. NPDC097619 TaxID=3157228 RepID=UPI00331D9BF3
MTAAALGTAPAAGAAPQPIGRCTTTSGAVLAVDFGHWGGPVYRSCGTTPTTGYALLNQGGWRTTGTGHDGPAFICRISYSGHKGGTAYPTPAQDDCVLTPPASAYWSYWHAGPGRNTWTYSQLGAMLHEPKPGSVELWTFGATNVEGTEGRPTISPDQLRAHNTAPIGDPTPTPKDTRTAAPVPPGTGTGSKPVRPKPTPSAPAATPTPSPSPTGSSAPPSPSAAATRTGPPAAAAPGDGPKVVDAAPAADTSRDTGSALPALATGALVLLIGGAAVLAARRRRTER